MQVRLLGPVELVGAAGPVSVGGPKERALLALLSLRAGEVVSEDTLVDALWGESPPRTAVKTLRSYVSRLRRVLADAAVDEGEGVAIESRPSGYILRVGANGRDVDEVEVLIDNARQAAAGGDPGWAAVAFTQALRAWRGRPLGEFADEGFARTEAIRLEELREAVLEERIDAELACGRHAGVLGELDALTHEHPLRERLWAQRMTALYRAGRQAEALRVYQELRRTLGDELGIEPSPAVAQLEQDILMQRPSLDWTAPAPAAARAAPSQPELPSGVVTFLLTDIEGSTELWDHDAASMAEALAAHERVIAEVVGAAGGQVLKARGEGDATLSVFRRASEAAAAAVSLQVAIESETWPGALELSVRVALHTGEAFERDGDYFGPALNRAARLRSMASGGQVLISQATAELIHDHLPDGAELVDLGRHELRGLARHEEVFELCPPGRPARGTLSAPAPASSPAATVASAPEPPASEPVRLPLPLALANAGPFVGRVSELERLAGVWAAQPGGGIRAALVGGEPGVGKTRLASEWAKRAHDDGALVLYGRCDEDLGAPYQPFAEAVRSVVPSLGAERLRSVRGIEELTRLVPDLTALVPGIGAPTQADPDTERYVLFDAIVRLLATLSAEARLVLVLDDLHWANKPTLLLLRHVLRFGGAAPIQIVGTYRSTDLSRTHPLAATMADLQREGSIDRIALSGLGVDDVNAYVAAAGYDDEELGPALVNVTAGNPFFLIEVLRHVDEAGGEWDPTTLPQGVREAVDRRLSRLSDRSNEALLVGAIAGSAFSLELVERVLDDERIDAVDEARHAGLVIEERGGRFRFNHALVRQSLLADVASVRRVRLHQRVAAALEATAAPGDDALVADLAHHYFECAFAGGAAKAVDYCRRAADQAMARLAYEEAAELYDRALQASEIDPETLSNDDRAELLVTRCEALLAGGDVTTASEAVGQLRKAAKGSTRLEGWAACFTGQLAVLTRPEELDAIERSVATAAEQLAVLGDAAGEAKAHTVRAACLARLGRVGDCETALDRALTAARRGGEHRRVNAVLAGAPLAALWGPNPVPRAGGRCLDVVRLLRITTGSPAVEATSTRCQAVLEAFRGRPPAARRMIESARRSLSELGLRHALLEVDLFAGIVELVAEAPADAERHLRRAYNGFRRMGVDVDAAQAAAFLARACVALDKDAEAEELCVDSERLGGHDLQSSIAWRAVRAQLLARRGDHAAARALAEAAVAIAERTDALVDHGDACLALATVLAAAGDTAGARAAADRAASLYERKGAIALVGRARSLIGGSGTRETKIEGTAPEDRSATLTNAASTVWGHVRAMFATRDWAGLAELFTGEVWAEDRRRVAGGALSGATDTFVEFVRPLSTVGFTHIDYTLLAARGERLMLASVLFHADQDEIAGLMIAGVDPQLRPDLNIVFDVDDIDAAYAELDERYLAGEAEPYARTYRTLLSIVDAYNRRDVRIADGVIAEDVVVVDHRLVGVMSAGDREGMRLHTRQELADVPDFVLRVSAIHALTDAGAVGAVLQTGHAADGGEVEAAWHAVMIVENERLVRQENFPEHDLEAALARFEELTHPAIPKYLDNEASRSVARTVRSLLSDDRQALRAALREDVVAEDRRRYIKTRFEGREAVAASLESVRRIGASDINLTPIATRGGNLVLMRSDVGGGGNQVLALTLIEIDDAGLAVAIVTFDPEDIDAAFAELDARYVAGEGAPHADVLARGRRVIDAYNRRDAGFLERSNLEIESVDHRLVNVLEAQDASTLLESLNASFDETPNIRGRVIAVHALAADALVHTHHTEGETRDGGAVENTYHVVAVLQDRKLSLEIFNETDLAGALARFEELTRPAVASYLDNAAGRLQQRVVEAIRSGDTDALLAMLADDPVLDDRRGLVQERFQGRARNLAWFDSVRDIGATEVRTRTIATRGDRLALQRVTVGGGGDEAMNEVESLSVFELDPNRRFAGAVVFDVDDLDAAYAELDARYVAGEAAVYADAFEMLRRLVAAYNKRDATSASLASDLIVVDHRLVQLMNATTSASFLNAVNSGIAMVPDFAVGLAAVHGLSERGGVISIGVAGTTHGGEQIEYEGHMLVLVDADRITRLEVFDDGALDEALARFEELRPRRPENGATPILERIGGLFARSRWDEYDACYSDDFRFEDRRRHTLNKRVTGRAAHLAGSRAMRDDAGFVAGRQQVLAVRGDRLVLHRTSLQTERGAADAPRIDYLSLVGLDEQGHLAFEVQFDVEDLEFAEAELEIRHRATGGAVDPNRSQPPNIGRWLERLADYSSIDTGEWIRPAVEWHDRRSGVQLDLVGADGLAFTQDFLRKGNATLEADVWATLGDRFVLGQWGVVVRDRAGFRLDLLMIHELDRAGRLAWSGTYDLDDIDGALSDLFDRWIPSQDAQPAENTATRLYERVRDCALRGAWDEVEALMSPEFRAVNRRRLALWGDNDRAAYLRGCHAWTDHSDVNHFDTDVLAMRGDDLALISASVRADDGTEGSPRFEYLTLVGTDSTGRWVFESQFDPEDIDAAQAELEARHRA